MSTSFSSSAFLRINTLFWSVSGSKEQSSASTFAASQKYKKFTDTTLNTKRVSFESQKAICSEFEASFSPFAQHEMEDLFKNAMKKLPVPFDPENSIYRNFYDVSIIRETCVRRCRCLPDLDL